MALTAVQLTELWRHEQEQRGYAASSRWYVGLSNAISYLRRAETATDPKVRFEDTWFAVYSLFMMHGDPGDEENKRLNLWVTRLKDVPDVRDAIQDPRIASCIQLIRRAERALLYDNSKPAWREGRAYLSAWEGALPSIDRAVRYFLILVRDIRNACMHPAFNPGSPVARRALDAAADSLILIATAAIHDVIERPLEGTTGRATAASFQTIISSGSSRRRNSALCPRTLPRRRSDPSRANWTRCAER
jgi:hypothetical protein